MGRAERRKAGKTEKVKTYVLTVDQIEQIKREAAEEAVKKLRDEIVKTTMLKVFKMFLAIPLMVLHDKFGFGKLRLDRFTNYVMIWYESVQNGETDINELIEIVNGFTNSKIVKEDPDAHQKKA